MHDFNHILVHLHRINICMSLLKFWEKLLKDCTHSFHFSSNNGSYIYFLHFFMLDANTIETALLTIDVALRFYHHVKQYN